VVCVAYPYWRAPSTGTAKGFAGYGVLIQSDLIHFVEMIVSTRADQRSRASFFSSRYSHMS
jgi:hypothetical protein